MGEGDNINGTLVENPVLNRSIRLTLSGGYDDTYSTVVGVTAIQGTLTIGRGTVTLENIEIR